MNLAADVSLVIWVCVSWVCVLLMSPFLLHLEGVAGGVWLWVGVATVALRVIMSLVAGVREG